MDSAKTIQGQEIKINAQKWHLHVNPKINDANITNTDIKADNGLIHVLDRVLMPDMKLTCPVCGMGFMTLEALITHTKMGHPVEKEKGKVLAPMPVTRETPVSGDEPNQIPCPVCGKHFKTHSELDRHMDATHHESKGHE